jgi:hypothetical protein
MIIVAVTEEEATQQSSSCTAPSVAAAAPLSLPISFHCQDDDAAEAIAITRTCQFGGIDQLPATTLRKE